MNFLFDTSIDVNRRQFYCAGNGKLYRKSGRIYWKCIDFRMERNNDFLWNLYVTYGRRKFHWN